MSRLAARTGVLFTMVLAPAAASAFSISLVDGSSGNVVRWGSSTLSYRLHSAGSADIVDGSDLEAVRAGWQQWQNVGCSALVFQEGAATTNKNTMAVGGPTNGQNEITWAEGAEWQLGQYVLGVTNTSYSVPDGIISEADIAFNGYQNVWSTTGKFNTIDVLNVAVHEEGHFFGAQHVLGGYDGNDPPTMATTADPDLKSQTIEPDDEKVACFLYPQGSFTCAATTDCPFVNDTDQFGEEFYAGQLACKSGKCGGVSTELPQGTGALGDSCASDYDCGQPLYCQPTGAATSLCAKDCTTQAQCGAGFECYPYSNAPGGVCLPGSDPGGTDGTDGTVTTKDPGEPCQSSPECSTGLCVGSASSPSGYCRESCQPGAPSCGAGETCEKLQSSGFGACLPSEGGSATGPAGTPCSSPVDCISGLCAGDGNGSYACRDACETALDNCPDGTECFGLVGGGGACFPSESPGGGATGLGGTCEFSDECASGLCVSLGGVPAPFCTEACGGVASCPCGLECVGVTGGESYCVPGAKVGCVPSGNACQSASECVSQTCVGGICRDPCTVAQPSCPSGQSCRRATPGSSVGICEAAGAAATGDACSTDSDCQTNLCELAVCRVACSPGTSGCGAGLACRQPAGARLAICVADEAADGIDTPGAGDGTDGVAADGSDGTDGADGTDAADGSAGSDGAADSTPDTGTSTGRGRSSGCAAVYGTSQVGVSGWLLAVLAAGAWVARRRRSNRSF